MAYQRKEAVGETVFDGGLDTKTSLIDLPLSKSPDMQDIIFDSYGSIQTRRGWKTHNSTPIASAVIDGGLSYTPNTMSAQLLVACNGAAYVATGAATAFVLIASSGTIWTAGVPIEVHQFRELAFFSNGEVKPYKFNGNEFTQMGVSAPTQNLTAVCDAAGNLDGAYGYVYTGVNSYSAEGDYGTPSTDVTIANGAVRVNNIPTAPASHGIEHWNIYRNTALASGVFWYVTCVTNGVTSFTDNLADLSLSTLAPTDNGSPRYFKYMINYLGRLWGAGDSNKDYLWFSDVNQPEVFPSTNFLNIGRGDGLDISGISVQAGVIVVQKSDFQGKTAVYLLFVGDPSTASDPVNWYQVKADSDNGSVSHRALVNYENVLFMLNTTGAYAFFGRDTVLNPSETDKGNLKGERLSFEIDPDIADLDSDNLKNAAAVDWKNKIWLTVPSDGSSVNDTVYVYDYVRASSNSRVKGAWSKFANHDLSKFVKHENKLFGLSSLEDGFVRELDTGVKDGATTHINSYFWTAPIKGQKKHYDLWKDFRWVYLKVDTASGEQIRIAYKTDSGAVTNLGYYDLSAAGSETTKTLRINLGRTSGYYLQLKFEARSYSAAVYDTFTVRELIVFYTYRGFRGTDKGLLTPA